MASVSKISWIVLCAAAVVAVLLVVYDRSIAYAMNSIAREDPFLFAISWMGRNFLYIVLIVGLVLYSAWHERRHSLRMWGAAFAGGVLAYLVATVGKMLVDRSRPFETEIGIVPLLASGDPAAFPSVTTAVFFGVAGTYFLFGLHTVQGRVIGGVLLLLALLGAIARVAGGIHWPTDVAAGIFIGFAIAAGIRFAFR